MQLMIIESPGKLKKLRAILGEGWEVAASVGHIRDLPLDEIGVEAPEFKPEYIYTPKTPIPGEPGKFYAGSKERVDRLAALVKQADCVYLATDPDREGESISWHLQQCLKLTKPLRVTFNEITATAVKAALLKPRNVDVQRVAAQEARRVLDRLVGYMVSPEISLKTSERLSAGRVQSVAVRLVVERERQIRNFQSTNHFGATLFFADAKTQWAADWLTLPNFVSKDEPYFMDGEFAQRVAETASVTVLEFKEQDAKRSPPPPFTTSTLLQAASVTLSLDPATAMEMAQKLFEQGHITYHRTDNPNVSDDALGDIYAVAVGLGLDMAEEPRKFKAPEGAQAGHPAITPTHWDVDAAGDSPEQQALYKMIRLRAIACQLADARYATRTVRLGASENIGGKALQFEGRGRTLVYSGWLQLVEKDATDESSEEGDEDEKATGNPIPQCAVGDILAVASGKRLAKRTNAPGRYTLASLVKKLESEAIGRPGTYAAIMENIVNRGYIERSKKFVAPTKKGELIVDSLVDAFQFMDIGFTRNIEQDLDKIALGEASYKAVVGKVYDQLQAELSSYQTNTKAKHPCPDCGKPLRRIELAKSVFWGCSGHPTCSTTLADNAGQPGEKQKTRLVTEYKCLACGEALIHRVKNEKKLKFDFFGCSGFNKGCKTAYNNKDGKPDYPVQTPTK